MENCNISFKSKIVVLSPNGHDEVCKRICKKRMSEYIYSYNIRPELKSPMTVNIEDLRGYRKNVKYGYTNDIRTCCAGVVADKGKGRAPFFWHLINSLQNKMDLSQVKDNISGTNAIIVGSKPRFKYSSPLFFGMCDLLDEKNIPTTMLRGLNDWWEVQFAYSAPTDTAYVCVNNIADRKQFVNSMKSLKSVFKRVWISKADTIEFLTPLQEFLLKFKKV